MPEIDGIVIDHDRLVAKMAGWKVEEADRNSDAAKTRSEIGDFTEKTGIHPKALSYVRGLDKMNEDKRNDVLRSLHGLLDTLEPYWGGQGTQELDLEPDDEGDDPQADDVGEHVRAEDGDLEPESNNNTVASGDDTVTPIDFGGEAA